MSVWCMAHPWMTLFIVLGAIQGLVHIVALLRGKDAGPEI